MAISDRLNDLLPEPQLGQAHALLETFANPANEELGNDEKRRASRALLDPLLRLPPEVLVSSGIEELVARPGHALGPPLSGNELIRLDETGVVEKPDVEMDGAEIVPVVDEGAPPRRAGIAFLEVEENAANEVQVSFHLQGLASLKC